MHQKMLRQTKCDKVKFGWQWMIATVAALFILILLIMHSDTKGPYVAPKLAGNTISTKSGLNQK
jgi:putative copper export protein